MKVGVDENGAATVTEAEVNTLMNLVIAKNIFATVNGNLFRHYFLFLYSL
jgi:hypothetical protein